MIKKVSIKLFLFTLIFLMSGSFTFAETNTEQINLHLYWKEGCPHCENEKEFFKILKEDYPQIQINEYEISKNPQYLKDFIKVGTTLNGEKITLVPTTIIGEKIITGYSEPTTSDIIRGAIEDCIKNPCRDSVTEILNGTFVITENDFPKEEISSEKSGKISLPLIGEINTASFSLPLLTIIIGALDGFNPCAMWSLIFLIGLLLGMKDKRRMWFLGGTFIFASAFVYFIFMTAWLNLLLFIGFVFWVQKGIGIVALGAGGYNLKEYITNKDASCKVTNTEKRKNTFQKIKEITQNKNFLLAFLGIIILAFAVNLVEAICSAGLPAIYTGILTANDLPAWKYYAYLLLYIFIFMLDDLIVFFASMKALQISGVTTKYTRASHLIGGIVMLILGLLLIFKPEYLMFG